MLLENIYLIFVITVVIGLPVPENSEYSDEEPVICAPQTPCRWFIHKYLDYDAYDVPNTYCICKNGTSCTYDQLKKQQSPNYRKKFEEYFCVSTHPPESKRELNRANSPFQASSLTSGFN